MRSFTLTFLATLFALFMIFPESVCPESGPPLTLPQPNRGVSPPGPLGLDDGGRVLLVRGDHRYPPYEYLNQRGEPEGFNIDIIRAVAQVMGLRITIDLGPWDEVREQLETGRINALAGMFKTRARDKVVDFTIPHFITSYAVFVRNDSTVQSLDDARGKTIIVQKDDLGHDFVKEQGITPHIITKRDWEDTLTALSSGIGDCAIVSRLQGTHYIGRLNIRNIKAVGPPVVQRKYCIAVTEGNAGLLATLNEGLSIIKNQGRYDEIYEKWFGVFESESPSLANRMKVLSWVLVPLILLLVIGYLWSWSLKKQVRTKADALMKELGERRRTEEKLRKSEAQLRQAHKMEAIGTLSGGIAHDFNNILAPIIGYAELSLSEVEEGTPLSKNLRQISAAAERARRLVKQILTFSRQTEEEIKPIGLKPIVTEAIKLIRSSLPSSIQIKQHIDSGAVIMGDATQVHQVLLNLCTNAGHAMQENGGLLFISLVDEVLSAGNSHDNPGLAPGRYAKLSVRDTGHGISAEIMESIFDPYFTTKDIGQGTGLGLAMIHGIVTEYGGEITVRSQPGQGSTFDVYLPVIEGDAPVEILNTSLVPGGTERILIVDDEQPVLDMMAQFFQRLGYAVVSESSSPVALTRFQAAPDRFDLVISDVTMPKMTGDRLTELITEIRRDVPVILCTGYSSGLSERKASAIGASALVMKPVALRTLAETVRRLLDDSYVVPREK